MKQLIREICRLISIQESFVLATVITRSGSAPRSSGARMLVRQDGATDGTVGGGILEAQVTELARQVQHDHNAVVRSFQFTGKDAATMDAICGGQVEVLVEWINACDPLAGELFTSLNAVIAGHKKAWFVSGLDSEKASQNHVLLHQDGTMVGNPPADISTDAIMETRQPQQLSFGQKKYYVEPIDAGGIVYIFGAGHVSRSLAEFTKAVGFWTVVLDDRADYVCEQRFPAADERIVLDTFTEALNRIVVDPDSFLVIVTRGHLHDKTVLAQALRTSAGYIGMIGSRHKCGLIFDDLRQQGFTDEDIQRVHAPIGLPIRAETPEEIGISIVAEMIQVRATMRE